MANTFTPTYNLIKPEVGSDTNAWGTHINANLDAIDTNMVSRTLTSAQTLAGAINLPSNGLNVGSGQLRVTGGNVTMSGQLTVSQATTLSTTLTVSSNVTFQGGFSLTGSGATSLGGTLSVTGATTLAYNGLNVGSGQLNCTGGNVTMSGALTVSGACSTGNKTVNGTMNVTGATTLAANGLNVGSGQLQVTGGNVTAAGNITASGSLNSASLSTNAISSTTINTNGNTITAGPVNCGAISSTTINTNGNTLTCGTISSGAINTNGNSLTSGSISTGSIGCGAITSTSINTQGNAVSCGTLTTNGNTLTCGSLNSGNISSSGTIASSGAMTISNTSPTLNMNDTDFGQFAVHCNSGQIGFLRTNGNWGCYIDNSGNFTAAGNVTAYSDQRLKKDVRNIDGALELVAHLRGVRYTRIDTEEPGVGVIAQEVQKVFPELVQDNGGTLSVAYGNLVGVLIEAVKELETRLKLVEAR